MSGGASTGTANGSRGAVPDLLLRCWTEADAPGLRDAIDEDLDHLKPWLTWTLEEPSTMAETRARLRRWIEAFRAGDGLRYAITPVDRPSRILGGAGLNRRLGPAAYTVGYWVRGSAVRRGIATAAVSRVVVHAFEQRGVHRLVMRVDTANATSASFARAVGFEPVGDLTLAFPDGTPRPVLELAMSREDYRSGRATRLRERAARARLSE